MIVAVLVLLPIYLMVSNLEEKRNDRFNEEKAYMAYRVMAGCASVDAAEQGRATAERRPYTPKQQVMRCTGLSQGFSNSADYYDFDRQNFHDVFWHIPRDTASVRADTP